MMTSLNGTIFRVTGHLCGEFTGPWWIPSKGQWRGALIFSLIFVYIKNGEAGDLRRHRAHYDVIVMNLCKRRLKLGHWRVITSHKNNGSHYLSMPLSKLYHVSERIPWWGHMVSKNLVDIGSDNGKSSREPIQTYYHRYPMWLIWS